MRRLILLRHAKSSWADPGLDDHDRPLNARGRLAAPLMGAWLAERGEQPDLVLLSTSRRTRETWERLRPLLPRAPDAEPRASLYHAEPATLLDETRALPAAARNVMLIGHQPGLGAFLRRLSSLDAPAGCARAFSHFPTAACAILDFDAEDWSGIDWNAGRFHAFATPADLV